MTPKYKVGQVVCKVTRPSHSSGKISYDDVTITKVGRKWAEYTYSGWDGKFCIKDTPDHSEGVVYAGNYSSNSRVYLSRQDYEDEIALRMAMRSLCSKLDNMPIRGVKLQDIKDAAALLKIELEY